MWFILELEAERKRRFERIKELESKRARIDQRATEETGQLELEIEALKKNFV